MEGIVNPYLEFTKGLTQKKELGPTPTNYQTIDITPTPRKNIKTKKIVDDINLKREEVGVPKATHQELGIPEDNSPSYDFFSFVDDFKNGLKSNLSNPIDNSVDIAKNVIPDTFSTIGKGISKGAVELYEQTKPRRVREIIKKPSFIDDETWNTVMSTTEGLQDEALSKVGLSFEDLQKAHKWGTENVVLPATKKGLEKLGETFEVSTKLAGRSAKGYGYVFGWDKDKIDYLFGNSPSDDNTITQTAKDVGSLFGLNDFIGYKTKTQAENRQAFEERHSMNPEMTEWKKNMDEWNVPLLVDTITGLAGGVSFAKASSKLLKYASDLESTVAKSKLAQTQPLTRVSTTEVITPEYGIAQKVPSSKLVDTGVSPTFVKNPISVQAVDVTREGLAKIARGLSEAINPSMSNMVKLGVISTALDEISLHTTGKSLGEDNPYAKIGLFGTQAGAVSSWVLKFIPFDKMSKLMQDAHSKASEINQGKQRFQYIMDKLHESELKRKSEIEFTSSKEGDIALREKKIDPLDFIKSQGVKDILGKLQKYTERIKFQGVNKQYYNDRILNKEISKEYSTKMRNSYDDLLDEISKFKDGKSSLDRINQMRKEINPFSKKISLENIDNEVQDLISLAISHENQIDTTNKFFNNDIKSSKIGTAIARHFNADGVVQLFYKGFNDDAIVHEISHNLQKYVSPEVLNHLENIFTKKRYSTINIISKGKGNEIKQQVEEALDTGKPDAILDDSVKEKFKKLQLTGSMYRYRNFKEYFAEELKDTFIESTKKKGFIGELGQTLRNLAFEKDRAFSKLNKGFIKGDISNEVKSDTTEGFSNYDITPEYKAKKDSLTKKLNLAQKQLDTSLARGDSQKVIKKITSTIKSIQSEINSISSSLKTPIYGATRSKEEILHSFNTLEAINGMKRVRGKGLDDMGNIADSDMKFDPETSKFKAREAQNLVNDGVLEYAGVNDKGLHTFNITEKGQEILPKGIVPDNYLHLPAGEYNPTSRSYDTSKPIDYGFKISPPDTNLLKGETSKVLADKDNVAEILSNQDKTKSGEEITREAIHHSNMQKVVNESADVNNKDPWYSEKSMRDNLLIKPSETYGLASILRGAFRSIVDDIKVATFNKDAYWQRVNKFKDTRIDEVPDIFMQSVNGKMKQLSSIMKNIEDEVGDNLTLYSKYKVMKRQASLANDREALRLELTNKINELKASQEKGIKIDNKELSRLEKELKDNPSRKIKIGDLKLEGGEIAKEYDDFYRQFENKFAVADAFNKEFNSQMLSIAVDSGLISKESYMSLIKNSEDYTKLKYIFKDAESYVSNKGTGFQKIKSGTEEGSIDLNVMKNTVNASQHIVAQSMRNKTSTKMVELAMGISTKNPNIPMVLVDGVPKKPSIKDIINSMNNNRISNLFEVSEKYSKDSISFYMDGHKLFMKGPKKVLDSIKKMTGEEQTIVGRVRNLTLGLNGNGVLKALDVIGSAPARLFKEASTGVLSPLFSVANAPFEGMNAVVNSLFKGRKYDLDAPNKQVIAKFKQVIDRFNNGDLSLNDFDFHLSKILGFDGGSTALTRNEFETVNASHLWDDVNKADSTSSMRIKDLGKAIVDQASKVKDTIHYVGGAMDILTVRYPVMSGEFRNALKEKGMSENDFLGIVKEYTKKIDGKNITDYTKVNRVLEKKGIDTSYISQMATDMFNFNKAGEIPQILNRYIPYFSTAIEGSRQTLGSLGSLGAKMVGGDKKAFYNSVAIASASMAGGIGYSIHKFNNSSQERIEASKNDPSPSIPKLIFGWKRDKNGEIITEGGLRVMDYITAPMPTVLQPLVTKYTNIYGLKDEEGNGIADKIVGNRVASAQMKGQFMGFNIYPQSYKILKDIFEGVDTSKGGWITSPKDWKTTAVSAWFSDKMNEFKPEGNKNYTAKNFDYMINDIFGKRSEDVKNLLAFGLKKLGIVDLSEYTKKEDLPATSQAKGLPEYSKRTEFQKYFVDENGLLKFFGDMMKATSGEALERDPKLNSLNEVLGEYKEEKGNVNMTSSYDQKKYLDENWKKGSPPSKDVILQVMKFNGADDRNTIETMNHPSNLKFQRKAFNFLKAYKTTGTAKLIDNMSSDEIYNLLIKDLPPEERISTLRDLYDDRTLSKSQVESIIKLHKESK